MYYKRNDTSLAVFTKEVERRCKEEKEINIEKFEEIMKGTADEKLKRVYTKRE